MWAITKVANLTVYDIMVVRGTLSLACHASATRIFAKTAIEDHIAAHDSLFGGA